MFLDVDCYDNVTSTDPCMLYILVSKRVSHYNFGFATVQVNTARKTTLTETASALKQLIEL